MEKSSAQPRPLARSSPRPLTPVAPFLLGVLVAAAAFYGWRAWREPARSPVPLFQPYPSSPIDLSALPRGGVLLVHPDTGRLFALRTRPLPAPAADGPLTLRALRITPAGGVKDTGSNYRLDTARGLLTAPGGKVYPVSIDSASGALQVQPSGKLHLNIRPAGLQVYVDGHFAGNTPLNTTVRAGSHQVEVRSASGREVLSEAPVEVPAGSTVSVAVTVPTPASGRVLHR